MATAYTDVSNALHKVYIKPITFYTVTDIREIPAALPMRHRKNSHVNACQFHLQHIAHDNLNNRRHV
jgi:hypothetical protein